jgi:hypothetical protein
MRDAIQTLTCTGKYCGTQTGYWATEKQETMQWPLLSNSNRGIIFSVHFILRCHMQDKLEQ